MAKALILTDDPAEAFQAQQILGELFQVVRACNTVKNSEAQMAELSPDLVIVYGLQGFSADPVRAAAQLRWGCTPAVLMCPALNVAGVREPYHSVRIVPPLNLGNALKAVHDLGLSAIVDQSIQNPHRRPAK